MTPTPTALHTPDSRWWWDGEHWLPAWSKDGRLWFNGAAWVTPFPAWRRWTQPTGAVVFVVGWVGGTVGGIMVMGDPGPGQVKTEPGWLVAASFATTALILVGLGLLLASPIHLMRARRARRRLAAAESRAITEAH